ncbi:TetR/AcrR family transcriptional regulator [Photobacterium sp. CCB-ST2H9]|uniref:TetR/AcrR family transcriptional regulator n=1 Tax=Photobacterium sp. CCB-ST2H9 TaxID=2912855 RepID=UPI002003DEF9|nr:TetR/AcrR family transcriptional regulator [Photobacterium sp. CCB-ST2H9]UTM56020.1 TetR/AcrR family transcriptional regulator [Photobacterium sp. CCB-ST2H9]
MSRGRPQDPEKQAQMMAALLDAAERLLNRKSYKSITIRELAAEAGTQSAMISYYFGNKEGLFLALLDRTGDMRQRRLQQVAGLLGTEPERVLPVLVSTISDIMTEEPWLINLVKDEVLASEGRLREHFVKTFPVRIGHALLTMFSVLQQKGILRAEINPRFATASMISLMAFPMIAEPLIQGVLGVDRQVLRSDAWKQHLTLLLTQGFGHFPAQGDSDEIR